MKKVAIIGAGITGLTIAYYLKQAGIECSVFEKSRKVGGVISTQKTGDYLFETGPNTGTISNVETVELFERLASFFELEIANEYAKKRLILKNGKWETLPAGIISGATTNLFSVRDKLKLLGEPFRKAGTNPDETIAELVKRRMGESFLDYAIDPFISGIYAGDPASLVTKYALPKLYNLEQKYGSFIGGAIKKQREVKTEQEKKVTKKIFSAKGGLSQIIKALSDEVGIENIYLNQNLSVKKEGDKYVINGNEFSQVVSTVNAKYIKSIFPFINKNNLQEIENLRYAKVVEITVGFKKWNGIDLNAFGGLIPKKENKNILGILFMSTLFKNRAPLNGALLTLFVGGVKKEYLVEMEKNELLKLLEPELMELLKLPDFNPDLLEVSVHKNAIAQYDKTSKERMEAIEQIEAEHKNLFLAGSIKDGIGMADRIKQATVIAKQILKLF